MHKYYVLDTNVLLHDPRAVLRFTDNTVVIPIEAIQEIDKFKKEFSERGKNAREVSRLLDELRAQNNLADGVMTPEGGMLVVRCPDDAVDAPSHNGNMDLQILRAAVELKREQEHDPVILVTKDINLRIRADAVGLAAQDYQNDRVGLADLYTGHEVITVSSDILDEFRREGRIDLPDDIRNEQGFEPVPNEYVTLTDEHNPRNTALARASACSGRVYRPHGGPDIASPSVTADTVDNGSAAGSSLQKLIETKRGICGVIPQNREQRFAIDALLDDSLRVVTMLGKAGTGKTLLAIAAGLSKVAHQKIYRSLLVTRPTFPIGKDLGYLPGTLSQKLSPWIQPICDTIELIIEQGGAIGNKATASALLDSEMLCIEPLTYIRGRNLPNQYVVVDEAQNLTPLEVKTVITRMGHHAKVVLTGDPYQIDNPYVDSASNGLSYLINRFRQEPLAAHVTLTKGERSELAELAANLL